ncbi:MAG: hypothetical protein HYS15_02620 [Candidatus Spechtbacteria bacterium]|nr:hypothetical protein [Candidatus Spechtbacteria bacterium]
MENLTGENPNNNGVETQSPEPLNKRERRKLRRKERLLLAEHAKNAGGRKKIVFWGIGILVIALLGFGLFRYLFAPAKDGSLAVDFTETCVTHSGGMHIHPRLRIIINETREDIPANIGISSGCMRPMHTHDGSGTIHIESPRFHEFTLGDFFKTWGKPFSATEILGVKVDSTHSLTMTVQGAANTEYEHHILKDAEEIEIRYEAKK